ncbi:hypothetical protein [Streptomyces sp. NBC_01669]|uniref:hypothetical protein n=1 Tax=Streptomyces sp. NBC_01669 TaxID=2975909 RepID=UPI002255C47F|nr:hypothetical protein [Streptomyces sp. NBC_01669]MCX4538558.1 hypothetical protein [Streptomyces sp. NBC_01669]
MADVVEDAATEGADLAAGHADRGRDHRLDDDAGGQRGRSVTAGGAVQKGARYGIGQRIGHDAVGRPTAGEQLCGVEIAHPGIGHGRDVVGQVVGHQPIGHRGLDEGVCAQAAHSVSRRSKIPPTVRAVCDRVSTAHLLSDLVPCTLLIRACPTP